MAKVLIIEEKKINHNSDSFSTFLTQMATKCSKKNNGYKKNGYKSVPNGEQ